MIQAEKMVIQSRVTAAEMVRPVYISEFVGEKISITLRGAQ